MSDLTSYHYHEVLHTSYVVMDTFYSQIVDHRAVSSNPELLEKAQAVFDTMYEFYQKVGEFTHDKKKHEGENGGGL